MYLILDEFIMGGEIQETSKKVLAPRSSLQYWHVLERWSIVC